MKHCSPAANGHVSHGARPAASAPGLPGGIDIAIMAKAPVPGLAKTRLIPALGAAGAARLQRLLTLRTLRTALRANLGTVSLWCAPDTKHRFFRALQQRCGIDCLTQPEADLGQRMQQALGANAFERPCLLVGTDCPALTPQHLKDAAAALMSGQDAVFVPVEDGGYVLVGLRRALPSIFADMAWSTPSVMQQTRARLRAVDATWRETALLWDVDLPADLSRLTPFKDLDIFRC